MPRIRTIKPEFFTSEDVIELSPLARLLFIALWCEADRDGRMVWKPKTFKVRYLPADNCDIEAVCQELLDLRVVLTYPGGDGLTLAWLPGFKKHQHCNPREAASRLTRHPRETGNYEQNNARVALIGDSLTGTRDQPDADASSTRDQNNLQVDDAQVGREGKGRERKGRELKPHSDQAAAVQLPQQPEKPPEKAAARSEKARVKPVDLADAVREWEQANGVKPSRSMVFSNAVVASWAEQGITVETLGRAYDRARDRRRFDGEEGSPISPQFLAVFVAEVTAAEPRAVPWDQCASGVDAKGAELGVEPYHPDAYPGGWQDFKRAVLDQSKVRTEAEWPFPGGKVHGPAERAVDPAAVGTGDVRVVPPEELGQPDPDPRVVEGTDIRENWWETPDGILAEGGILGIQAVAGQTFDEYTARVIAKAAPLGWEETLPHLGPLVIKARAGRLDPPNPNAGKQQPFQVSR